MINYNTKTTKQLIQLTQKAFNAYIRHRDRFEPCINCNQFRTLQAGHFFSAGKYPNLRFNEDNVHGECKACNYYKSESHAYKYRPNLINKIGQERFDKIELLATSYNPPFKWNRWVLIELIEYYKDRIKHE